MGFTHFKLALISVLFLLFLDITIPQSHSRSKVKLIKGQIEVKGHTLFLSQSPLITKCFVTK